jgi:hypothetical protein
LALDRVTRVGKEFPMLVNGDYKLKIWAEFKNRDLVEWNSFYNTDQIKIKLLEHSPYVVIETKGIQLQLHCAQHNSKLLEEDSSMLESVLYGEYTRILGSYSSNMSPRVLVQERPTEDAKRIGLLDFSVAIAWAPPTVNTQKPQEMLTKIGSSTLIWRISNLRSLSTFYCLDPRLNVEF